MSRWARPARSTGAERVLSRGGVVGTDLSRVDWERSALGPLATWPKSLVSVLQTLLTSRFAMWLAWGDELTFFCNDAYRTDTLATKYPWALGRSAREVWHEIWDDIGPRIESVLQTGEATWDESLMLFLERSGYREETYHTFSYSPVEGDDGTISGMLCVVAEETERVIGQRRMLTLRDLASGLAGARTEPEILASIEEVLADNPEDLPFTLTYHFDDAGPRARLVATTGTRPGAPAAPETITLDGPAPTLAGRPRAQRRRPDHRPDRRRARAPVADRRLGSAPGAGNAAAAADRSGAHRQRLPDRGAEPVPAPQRGHDRLRPAGGRAGLRVARGCPVVGVRTPAR